MPDTPPDGPALPVGAGEASRILLAARDYLITSRAIHVVEGSTDVHHHGGMAGQALTPHCAWECGATGVRYVNEGGVLKRIVEPPPHGLTLTEWHRAESELVEALREAGIIA